MQGAMRDKRGWEGGVCLLAGLYMLVRTDAEQNKDHAISGREKQTAQYSSPAGRTKKNPERADRGSGCALPPTELRHRFRLELL
jgi:hypothetical protein